MADNNNRDLNYDDLLKQRGIKNVILVYRDMCKGIEELNVFLDLVSKFFELDDNDRMGELGKKKLAKLFQCAIAGYDRITARKLKLEAELRAAMASNASDLPSRRKVILELENAQQIIQVVFISFFYVEEKDKTAYESFNVIDYRRYIVESWNGMHDCTPEELVELCISRNEDMNLHAPSDVDLNSMYDEEVAAFMDGIVDLNASEAYVRCGADIYKAIFMILVSGTDSKPLRALFYASKYFLNYAAFYLGATMEELGAALMAIPETIDDMRAYMSENPAHYHPEIENICNTMTELIAYFNIEGSLHKEPIEHFTRYLAHNLAKVIAFKRNLPPDEQTLEELTESIYNNEAFCDFSVRQSIVFKYTASEVQLNIIADRLLATIA